jgi:hypothetical protein
MTIRSGVIRGSTRTSLQTMTANEEIGSWVEAWLSRPRFAVYTAHR